MHVFKIPPDDLPSFTDPQGVTTGQGRVEHRLFKRDQSWCYEAMWALCGHKLRVMVTRNAYDQQSFCKVQSFDLQALEWKFLCDLPFNKDLACFKVSWTAEQPDQTLFEIDADIVIEKACRILNPFYAAVTGPPEDVGAPKAAHITKIELVARVYFSDGTTVDRPVDRS